MLASSPPPTFWLEVWARRDEIDIDPETYASLRNARRAPSFVTPEPSRCGLRGRTTSGMLAAAGALALEAADRALSVARRRLGLRAGSGATRVARTPCSSGSFRTLTDPDRRSGDAADPPATRFELALDAYDGEADWGSLLAGTRAPRLPPVERHLPAVPRAGPRRPRRARRRGLWRRLPDSSALPRFAAGRRRRPAHPAGLRREPRARRRAGRRHARRRRLCRRDADPGRARRRRATRKLWRSASLETLHRLFEESLYVLYRLLFILYAESRDILPMRSRRSLRHDLLASTTSSSGPARRRAAADGTYYGRRGPAPVSACLDSGPGTQHEARHPAARRRAVRSRRGPACSISSNPRERLARGADVARHRRAGQRRAAPRTTLELRRAGRRPARLDLRGPPRARAMPRPPEPAVLVGAEGRAAGPPRRARLGRRAPDPPRLDAGDFVLESARAAAQGHRLLLHAGRDHRVPGRRAIDPLVEPILDRAADGDPTAPSRSILDVRVCDPAMGSGAFLVQAARVLGLGARAGIRAVRQRRSGHARGGPASRGGRGPSLPLRR